MDSTLDQTEDSGGTFMTWRLLIFFAGLSLLIAERTSAQSTRSLINKGNDRYEEGKFDEAEISYRKALEKEKDLVPGHFNLGNSLHKQKKFDQSVREFETAAVRAMEKETKADALYNMGNAFAEAGQYDKAVKSYVESLRLDPSDQDAKYNLSYALRKLREQPQQEQRGGDKQQEQDQQQKNDQQKEQQQQQEQQGQDQSKPQQRQSAQHGEKQISRADAERILEVLKNNERDVQKKLRARKSLRVRTDRDW
jgi:tetratricopeptide (TPR) repeat protein